MPLINGKHFAYTPKGKKAAKKYSKRKRLLNRKYAVT